MIIVVGSANSVKVEAVKEVLKDYPLLSEAQILSYGAASEISEQPLSLEETICGAKNRAINAFKENTCHYSLGIESGLIEAPGTASGFLEACICSFFDGEQHFIGLSSGFEVPLPILNLILEKNLTLSDACFSSGITQDPKLGSAEGLIGILTKNRLNRKLYTKQAITTALIGIENANWYSRSAVLK